MTSLFQVIAHEDANDQGKLRQAMALAHQRVEDRFGAFVRKGSIEDQGARYSLVEEDIRAVIAAACEQVGFADVDGVLRSIGKNFISEPEARKVASTVHEARKPKMCPYHSEVMDISLAQGEPQAGFNAMAQHAWSERHCQGEGYKGDNCKFKPAMTTQSYWDERSEKAEQRRNERAERQEQEALQAEPVNELPEVETPEVEPVAEVEHVEHNEPSAIGEGVEAEAPMLMAASTKTSEYKYVKKQGDEWVIVQKGTGKVLSRHDSEEKAKASFRAMETNMHGGSVKTAADNDGGTGVAEPKMDKRKWTPKTVPEVDIESKDHPSRRKDVTMPIKLEQGEQWAPSKLKEVGEKTTERQDVTQKGGIDRASDQGGTFGGGERSAVSSRTSDFDESPYGDAGALMQQPPDPHASPNVSPEQDQSSLTRNQRMRLQQVLMDMGVDPNAVLQQMDQADMSPDLPQMRAALSGLLDENSIKQALAKFKRA